jgi:hypothetical protein
MGERRRLEALAGAAFAIKLTPATAAITQAAIASRVMPDIQSTIPASVA